MREKIEKPDVAVVLGASLLDPVGVCVGLKPGGTLVANLPQTKMEVLKRYQDRFRVAVVDARADPDNRCPRNVVLASPAHPGNPLNLKNRR